MPKTSSKPSPRWSPRKRLVVTGLISTGIFLLALIIGSSLYAGLYKKGLVQSQSIKKLVYQRVVTDDNLSTILSQVSQQATCTNEFAGITLAYDSSRLIPYGDTRTTRCLDWRLSSNPKAENPGLTIRPLYASIDETVQIRGSRLNNLTVDFFDHSQYASRLLIGTSSGAPHRLYLLSESDNITWIISFTNVTRRELASVDNLVRSIKFIGDY